MECSFESTENYAGGFIKAKCVAKAEVGGLCWHCAYKALQAENKLLKALCLRESMVLKEALSRPKNNKSMIAVVAASLEEAALTPDKDGNGIL